MKKSFLPSVVFAVLLHFGCSSTVSFDQESVRHQIPLSETEEIIGTLASDDMKGRDTKSGGYYKAAAYVIDYFKAHNIQPFYPEYKDSLVTDSLLSYNVVGHIGPFLPQRKTVLIGAHLDHIGIKGSVGDTLYNGANDNASGSTAALQIGAFLAQHTWEQNIVISLFADEEKGLKGAEHLAERMKKENVKLDYLVNFEMLGTVLTTGENQVYLTGYEHSNMAEVFNAVSPNFVQFLPEAKAYNLFKRSDNYPFAKTFGVAAQTFATFDFKNYDHYHGAEDEVENLNLENLNAVIGTAAYSLAVILQNKTPIIWNQKEEAEQ